MEQMPPSSPSEYRNELLIRRLQARTEDMLTAGKDVTSFGGFVIPFHIEILSFNYLFM